MVSTGQLAWESADDAYARGVKDTMTRQRERESLAANAFAGKIMSLLQPAQPNDQRSTPGSYGRFARAVEHVVTDLDAASAATPHGVVALGTSRVTPLAEAWMNDSMRATNYATLIEQTEAGVPSLPMMTTPPTAGRQPGEKREAYSVAFDITTDDGAAVIDSTLYLNVSGLIDTAGGMGICQALMRAAVAHEASAQITEAITNAGTDAADLAGGFAAFDGSRFTPSVVVIPPSALFNVDAVTLAAAGISVVVDAAATSTLIVDPMAVVGWFKRLSAEATEPSMFGYGVAFATYGKVSVDPTGVAVIAAA